MLPVYLDQCLPFSAFLSETSLNELVSCDFEANGQIEVVETLPDITIDIEGDFHKQEMIDLVARFVSTLSDYHQTIVLRYFWDGDSQSEIAAEIGVSQQSISYALAKVAQMGREFFAVTIH